MNTVQKIARNVSVFFVANVLTLLLGFISLSITGRYLGAELFGVLSLALAFFGMFSIISDLGLSTLTTREVARDKSLITGIRIFLAILTFGLIVGSAMLLGYAPQTIYVISIVAISLVFTTLTAMYNSVFQAFEKMKYQSLGVVLNSVLFLCGVAICIKLSLDVVSFAAIYFFVGAIVLVYSWAIFRRKCSRSKLERDPVFWRSTLNTALPFALASIFSMMFFWIDSVLLSVFKGVEVVGWYSAAYRLMVVLLIIPTVINSAVFPAMSRFFVDEKKRLLVMRDTYFRYMVVIGVPIGVAITFFGHDIILLVFGTGYVNSVVALQILVWASVFIFLGSPFTNFLVSADKQVSLTKVALICLVENVVLNLILIPPFGLIAASLVTVLTECTSFLLVLLASGAVTKRSINNGLLAAGKIALAGALMAATIFAFDKFTPVLLTFAAVCIYFGALYVTRIVGKTDVMLLTQILHPEGDQKQVTTQDEVE
jgi:O-antigen/teichoic acid export membrane protein